MKIINMPEQDTSCSGVTDMQEKDTDRVTEKMPDPLMLCPSACAAAVVLPPDSAGFEEYQIY